MLLLFIYYGKLSYYPLLKILYHFIAEEYRDTLTSTSYSENHWAHFGNRHKRELASAQFHSNEHTNGKQAYIFVRCLCHNNLGTD